MNQVGLSNGEWKIMKRLWISAPCTITELVESLKEETGWGKHTVITMLGRMEAKGVISHEEGTRAKQFYPLVLKEEVSIEETKGFLEKVYNGSLSMMINAMVEKDSLSKEEIKELYDILKKAEDNKKEGEIV